MYKVALIRRVTMVMIPLGFRASVTKPLPRLCTYHGTIWEIYIHILDYGKYPITRYVVICNCLDMPRLCPVDVNIFHGTY